MVAMVTGESDGLRS